MNIYLMICFTPNDSMESTETLFQLTFLLFFHLFHPQRLDGEY